MSTIAKRSKFAKLLNTGSVGTPVWSRIGDGVTSAEVNYNPETSKVVYIHQDSGNTEVESYSPTLPLEAELAVGDPVLDLIDGLRQSRATLSEAHKELLMVYLYETPVAEAYPAERQSVSVQIDNYGGEGGQSVKVKFTLNFRGDAIKGTYNPTTGTFTPDA